MSHGSEENSFIHGNRPEKWEDPCDRLTISVNLEQQHLPGAEQNNAYVPWTEADCVISEVNTFGAKRHAPVIDLDLPVRLIPSTTPGHFHLYIDRLMSAEDMFDLLDTMARVGLVEPGYAEVSRARGYSSVRLPWVKKDVPRLFCFRCQKAPSELDEYIEMAGTYQTPAEYCLKNEGTLNRDNGHFCCTQCYIEIGQPTGERGKRWVAP